MPADKLRPRLGAARPDGGEADTVGPLYENPTYTNLSPRGGFAWDLFGDGRTSVRGGYGLYFNTNNHQNLIVTVTNPPFTPRPVIVNPTFPNPPFERAGAISIRPIQYDLANPARARLQRQPAARTVGAHRRDRRLRRLARHAPAAQQRRQHRAPGHPGGRHAVLPGRHAAPEHRLLDHRAEEQRRRLLVQRPHPRAAPPLEQRPLGAVLLHVVEERRHHAGVDLLLGRHQRHDLRDAGVRRRLQQGPVRLPRRGTTG